MIILVRHGETIWKTMNITQGQLDSPLTENGVKQAQLIHGQFKDVTIEVIISSPLGRAIKTAEIICQKLELQEIIIIDELKERYEGSFEGLNKTEQIERYPNLFYENKELIDLDTIPFAEPVHQFQERVKIGLERIKSMGKRAIVVTHSGVIQAANVICGKMKHDDFGKSKVGYLDFSIYEL